MPLSVSSSLHSSFHCLYILSSCFLCGGHSHVWICTYVSRLGVCYIVTHITAPDVQFALQPHMNGGTDRKREQDDVGVMPSKQKRVAPNLGWVRGEWINVHFYTKNPKQTNKKTPKQFKSFPLVCFWRDLQILFLRLRLQYVLILWAVVWKNICSGQPGLRKAIIIYCTF